MPLGLLEKGDAEVDITIVQGVTAEIVVTVPLDLTGATITFKTVNSAVANLTNGSGITLVGGTPSTVTVEWSAAQVAALPISLSRYILTAQLPSGGDTIELMYGYLLIGVT